MSEGPESARAEMSPDEARSRASEAKTQRFPARRRPPEPQLESGPYQIAEWAIHDPVSRLTSAKSFDMVRASAQALDVAIRLASGTGGVLLHQDEPKDGATDSPRGGLAARVAKNVDAERLLADARVLDMLRECMKTGRAPSRDGLALELELEEQKLLALPLRVRIRSPRPVETGVPPRERRRFPQQKLVKPVGAILVARTPEAPPIGEDQLRGLEAFSSLAAEVLVHARLYQEATRDALTDFYERRELERLLQVEITLAQHAGVPISVLLVAIDGLGRVLERTGRTGSDRVVERTARLVRAQVRDEDSCVRYGAGEFALLLPSTDEAGAAFAGEKIRKSVAEYGGFGNDLALTVSVGAAVFPQHGDGAAEIVRRADRTALLAASEGGNRVAVWSEENEKKTQKLETLRDQLTRSADAVENEQHVPEPEPTEEEPRHDYGKIVGKSRAMRKVFRMLDRVTDSDVAVLIQGETGTGKELVARALHQNGRRKGKPFVSVNCSAIAESLMESELFGHVKGAFTGADQDKKGLFEQADGGTILLDEVQDMSRSLQRELLRVIQEQEVRRVGGKDTVKVDVRVISATNRDLRELVKKGEFREDLYYRLNVLFIELPPLRQRKEDIPKILERLVLDHAKRTGRAIEIDKGALRAILKHDWPGNVRELENWFERTCLMLEGTVIREGDVAVSASGAASMFEGEYDHARVAFLREYLRTVLARNAGNVTRAANEAGIVRSSFHKMMRRFGLQAKDFRTR